MFSCVTENLTVDLVSFASVFPPDIVNIVTSDLVVISTVQKYLC